MFADSISVHFTLFYFLAPSAAGKILGGVCSVSGVILITPLLPIIYNKFDRFQKLEDNKLTARHRSRASVKLR